MLDWLRRIVVRNLRQPTLRYACARQIARHGGPTNALTLLHEWKEQKDSDSDWAGVLRQCLITAGPAIELLYGTGKRGEILNDSYFSALAVVNTPRCREILRSLAANKRYEAADAVSLGKALDIVGEDLRPYLLRLRGPATENCLAEWIDEHLKSRRWILTDPGDLSLEARDAYANFWNTCLFDSSWSHKIGELPLPTHKFGMPIPRGLQFVFAYLPYGSGMYLDIVNRVLKGFWQGAGECVPLLLTLADTECLRDALISVLAEGVGTDAGLITALASSEASKRHVAVEAILRRKTPSLDGLLSLLRDGDVEVRRRAAQALTLRTGPRAQQSLLKLLSDPDSQIRHCAAKQLASSLDSPQAFREMLAHLGRNLDLDLIDILLRHLPKLAKAGVRWGDLPTPIQARILRVRFDRFSQGARGVDLQALLRDLQWSPSTPRERVFVAMEKGNFQTALAEGASEMKTMLESWFSNDQRFLGEVLNHEQAWTIDLLVRIYEILSHADFRQVSRGAKDPASNTMRSVAVAALQAEDPDAIAVEILVPRQLDELRLIADRIMYLRRMGAKLSDRLRSPRGRCIGYRKTGRSDPFDDGQVFRVPVKADFDIPGFEGLIALSQRDQKA